MLNLASAPPPFRSGHPRHAIARLRSHWSKRRLGLAHMNSRGNENPLLSMLGPRQASRMATLVFAGAQSSFGARTMDAFWDARALKSSSRVGFAAAAALLVAIVAGQMLARSAPAPSWLSQRSQSSRCYFSCTADLETDPSGFTAKNPKMIPQIAHEPSDDIKWPISWQVNGKQT